MKILLYNSLTNKVELFKPLKENKVSIYICGPTVYNDPHIGNIRPVVVFDVLKRLFLYLNYKVTFVSNYTDIDDKIIEQAEAKKMSEEEITNYYIEAFKKVVEQINSYQPDISPRVTNYIPEIINYIGDLLQKGAAYEVTGDVFFRVASIEGYGQLSKINVDDLLSGARVEENIKKESPLDFILWKKTSKGLNWDSPWSRGRPGWHTECCVMINTIFEGGRIDIHGGGFDLKFPHHENEIAQSKAHSGHLIANYWLHNGYIIFDQTKMSKSLGNVILAKDMIEQYGGNVVRLLLLSTHYRAPLNITEEVIKTAQNEWQKIQNTLNQLSVILQLNNISLVEKANIDISEFIKELANDLNTPNALTYFYAQLKAINTSLRQKPLNIKDLLNYFFKLEAMFSIFGFSFKHPLLDENDKMLYNKYLKYKSEKNFAESDRIRKILMEKNIL
ncbi:MAG: cysteine--tRNA ligase [Bacilli bacterium]|jgi:cysteinyl-tRNA synthetase|nr:cysteine--tRNA ligase [Bacilli bacterium]NLN80038.1 cysteine--tRNA ligase [Erysipelotrichia bacterium]